jgi:uncharacterized protein (DUF433 family)
VDAKFTRITVDPDQMGGVPCVRNLRIPVSTVVSMVEEGMSESDILAAYPDLEFADIRESVRFGTAVEPNDRKVIRRHVLRAVRELNDGKYTEYKGTEGSRELAAEVKSRGRRRLAKRQTRKAHS